MNPTEMDRLIQTHVAAENVKEPAQAVSVYTEDLEHDVVVLPTGPVHGKQTAQRFYGSVPGEFLDIPGQARRTSFGMVHLWEFRDELITLQALAAAALH